MTTLSKGTPKAPVRAAEMSWWMMKMCVLTLTSAESGWLLAPIPSRSRLRVATPARLSART
jgi:hypothetical protein